MRHVRGKQLSVLVVGVALLCALVTACGSDPKRAERLAGKTLAGTTVPPERTLITQSAINDRPAGSPERRLVSLWSDLQWQSWREALGYYSPALLEFAGASKISSALRNQATYFRAVKLTVTDTVAHGTDQTVRYTLTDARGVTSPQSTTFERQGAVWYIVYDSYLDEALRVWAQNRAQQTVDPNAKTPSRQAVVAGTQASELQADFAENQLRSGSRR
jgi:hypothetical protein